MPETADFPASDLLSADLFLLTLDGLGHLGVDEAEDGPVGVPVVHLPEAAAGNDETVIEVDERGHVIGGAPHAGVDLAAEVVPPAVDILGEGLVLWVLLRSNDSAIYFSLLWPEDADGIYCYCNAHFALG